VPTAAKETRRTLATGRMKLTRQTAACVKSKAAAGCRSPKASPFRTLSNSRKRFGLRQSSAAFSLIELMVVVVLIGILSAMILPAMKGTFDDALLRSTARKLVDAFTLANARAVATTQLHRVRVDRNARQYVVERRVHDAEQGSGFLAVRDIPGAAGELDSRISIEIRRTDEPSTVPGEVTQIDAGQSHPDAIAFYQDGTAEEAEIILKDRENFRLSLRINPTTARVRLVELGRP
jgi:type II secretion system protein H